MSSKVLILAGAANSGKTTTLKALISRHNLRRVSRNVYRLHGKIVCLRVSSPQERSGFCNLKGVMKKIRYLLRLCGKRDGSLVIIPFTIQFDSRINRRCIVSPIKELKDEGCEVHVVYLRKQGIEGLAEADALMRGLRAEIIGSGRTKRDAERQSESLWRIVQRIDP